MIEQLKKLKFEKDLKTSVWKKLNYSNFNYSDGDDIEEYILQSIQSCKDRSVASMELRNYIKDWASLYHLSRRRSNILRPFADKLAGKRILEIGCGMGALSRFMGEIGSDVISIEGSPRRAFIARERCKDLYNVEIVCATSDEISELRQFDFVILNGVLEYSSRYLGKNGPTILLKQCFGHLNESGTLILAIENQLGLKYFAGFPEDHAGKEMYGVNDSYRVGEFKTWGKKELLDLVAVAGFQSVEQFIPLPDYKLPVSIVTPTGWMEYSEDLSQFAVESVIQDFQKTQFELFSMEMAYKVTWKNGLAAELANSFLLIANKDINRIKIIQSEIAAFHYTDNRIAGKNKRLLVIKGNDCELKIMKYNLDFSNKIETEKLESLPGNELEEFHKGESYWFGLIRILNRPDWSLDEIVLWAVPWINALKVQANISDDAGFETRINGKWVDATPFNAILKNDGMLQFFDLEKPEKDEVTFGFVIFRGLLHSFVRITTISPSVYYNEFENIITSILLNLGFSVSNTQIHKWIDEDLLFSKFVTGFNSPAPENDHELVKLSFRNTTKGLHFKILDLNNKIIDLNNKIIDLNNKINYEKQSIENSFSWKITKPVRYLSRLFKKITDIKKYNFDLLFNLLQEINYYTLLKLNTPYVMKNSILEIHEGDLKEDDYPDQVFFAHYDLQGIIDDYVVNFLQELFYAGFAVHFVSTCVKFLPNEIDKIKKYTIRIVNRKNIGWDFGSWYVAWYLSGKKYQKLIFTNDSVYGPLFPLKNLLNSMDKTNADVYGASSNNENARHMQSYFVVMNENAIKKGYVNSIFENYIASNIKEKLIHREELSLTRIALKLNLKWDAFVLFENLNKVMMKNFQDPNYDYLSNRNFIYNPTHFSWKKLIEVFRFPFIKVDLVRDNGYTFHELDNNVIDVIKKTGYDISLIKNHLDRIKPGRWEQLKHFN